MNQVAGYIICENDTSMVTPQIISSSKSDRVIINTILQDGDVINRNKRVYPTQVLKNGLQSEYVQERLATKTWFGEAGHPLKPDMARQLYMDQSNMSHRVNKIWWENNVLWGEVEAAATARGNDFDGIVRSGGRVGFSLRAVGPITKQRNGYVEICDPLTMYCYDWILHPSHRVAYMSEVISESAKAGNVICESAGVFTPYYSGSPIAYIKEASQNFKLISEQFEVGCGNKNEMYLSEDARKVYITNESDVIAVNIENHLHQEISAFMAKLK